MTALTPEENALVAYAILDEVNDMLANGGRVEDITRDIARAQVYATLATMPLRPLPTQEAIVEAISDVLDARGPAFATSDAEAAAEAVRGLL